MLEELIQLATDLKRCRPWIEAAIAEGAPTHTFDDFCVMVMQQRVRFWPLPNSFMASEVNIYPREKHFHVWLAGGSLVEIMDQQEALVEAARAEGCTRLTLTGRNGWVKALHKLGWQPAHTSVYFDVGAAE